MASTRIHITGGSGCGVTTLGAALAMRLSCPHHDTDDFYWTPTDPPFLGKREVPDRLRLMEEMFPTGANSNPRISDATEIAAGDIVMVANCEQAAVFRVTGTPAFGVDTVELQHAAPGGGLFVNTGVSLSNIGRTYQEDALVGRVQSTFFFIAEGEGLSNILDGGGNPTAPLALYQKVGTNQPVELVQGIENLQVLYGIDTTDDDLANANEYVTADDLDLFPDPAVTNVVALRVSVTANSVDAVTEDGNPLRRTFTKTILLRNANPEFP